MWISRACLRNEALTKLILKNLAKNDRIRPMRAYPVGQAAPWQRMPNAALDCTDSSEDVWLRMESWSRRMCVVHRTGAKGERSNRTIFAEAYRAGQKPISLSDVPKKASLAAQYAQHAAQEVPYQDSVSRGAQITVDEMLKIIPPEKRDEATATIFKWLLGHFSEGGIVDFNDLYQQYVAKKGPDAKIGSLEEFVEEFIEATKKHVGETIAAGTIGSGGPKV